MRESNLIDYIIMSTKSLLLIDFNDDSDVKLFKIIMLSNKYIDTYSLFKDLEIRLNWRKALFRALL